MSTLPANSSAPGDTDEPDATALPRVRQPQIRGLHRRRVIPVSEVVSDHDFAIYLRSTIRGISPYYARARISIAYVPIARIRPLSRIAEAPRYRRAQTLVRMLRLRRMDVFEPCLLRYRGESGYRLALPPVVERTDRSDNALVVVDGVHRLLALSRSRSRKDKVKVVVISGARLPRPAATPVGLADVKVWPEDTSRAKKFHRLKPKLFRPAGSTLRSERFRFESVESFLAACRATSG